MLVFSCHTYKNNCDTAQFNDVTGTQLLYNKNLLSINSNSKNIAGSLIIWTPFLGNIPVYQYAFIVICEILLYQEQV